MNPYSQLQLMQQSGVGQFIPGRGNMSPQSGGAAGLQAMSKAYGSPISGESMVDTSPMGGIGYNGPGSNLINFAGNMFLMPMMQRNGMMPTGNAGSYEQAYRANQFQQMQQAIVQNVAKQDADSLFRNMRGAAAMAGMPMNTDQTEAARSLAQTIANVGPTIDMIAPGLLDAVSGETGSIQSLASQVMSANRYRLDPSTGRLGYSTESNQQLIENLFENMFNADNLTSMQGLRAGDMGGLYDRLSAEGLAGPRGTVRDRTVAAIQSIQGEGGDASLTAQAKQMGISLDDVAGLSNADLTQLRENNSTVSSRITKSDTDRISSQLKDYVSSLAAIREVFGENGNPNAPIPELIGALEALTNNKTQQFDASRLNTMVRDMQALSQASGKSIDQLTAMQQSNISNINSMTGYGGEHFAGTSTNYGVTTGQAFQQVGGARGFGALSRTEAEQAAQSLFNRSMDSEMANSLGTVARIEETGGINDNAAGKDLKKAMEAVRSGDEFYQDSNGVTRRTPTREMEFRSFFQRGAVDGMDVSDFNMMLGQEFANKKALAESKSLQRGTVRQQFFEFEKRVNKEATGTVLNTKPLEGLKRGKERSEAAAALTSAATAAMFDLTPEEFADDNIRRQAMVDALQAEAAVTEGVTIDDVEARQIADQIYGSSNEVALERTGISTLGLMQVQGRKVSNVQRTAESQASALSGRNEAMSLLGPKGSGMQRLFSAIQKAGDRGESSDLTTLLGDMFGADSLESDELSENMESVRDLREQSIDLSSQLGGASPEERNRLDREILDVNKKLSEATARVKDEGRRIGVVGIGGEFNYEDVRRSREALREISSRTDRAALRDFIGTDAVITDADVADATSSKITKKDKIVLAEAIKKEEQELLGSVTDAMILGGSDAEYAPDAKGAAQKRVAEDMRTYVVEQTEAGLMTEAAALRNARETKKSLIDDTDYSERFDKGFDFLSDLKDLEMQKQVLRGRKSEDVDKLLSVSREDVESRMELRREKLDPLKADATLEDMVEHQTQLDARMSDDEFKEATTEMREAGYDRSVVEQRKRLRNEQLKVEFKEAQDQLIAERGLQATGILDKNEKLINADLDDADISDEIRDMLTSDDPSQQRKALTKIARNKRRSSLFSAKTDRGDISTQDVRGVSNSLAKLDASADEYLRDSDAIMRGGESGLAAATDYQEARKDLQAMANKYSVEKGELGAGELLTQGVDRLSVQEKAYEEFDEMGQPELDETFKKVTKAVEADDTLKTRFDGVDLLKDRKAFKDAYAAVRTGEEQQKLSNIRDRLDTAAEGMEAGATADYRNILEVSSEQIDSAKELFGEDAEVSSAQAKAYSLLKSTDQLGDDPEKNKERVNEVAEDLEYLQSMDLKDSRGLDDKAAAEKSAVKAYEQSSLKDTMSKKEYLQTVRGDSDIESLELFDGDTPRLSKAAADIEEKNQLERRLADQKVSLKRRGGKDKQAESQIADIESQLTIVQERIDDDRGGMAEDEYRTKIRQQGDIKKLKARQEQYAKMAGPDSDLLTTRGLLTDAADAEADKLGEIGDPTDVLLKAIGFETSDDERKSAKDTGFGSSHKNISMVAAELKKLEKVEIAGAETGIQKLDAISDMYEEAGVSSKKKNELAEKLNMDREELDSMMTRTDFMGLDKEGLQFADLDKGEQAEKLKSMFKSVENKDLKQEIQEEEDRTMKLTGTLEVVGDVIQGEAKFSDVAGLINSTGAV